MGAETKKRAQTMQNTSFGCLGEFFFLLIRIIFILTTYLGYNLPNIRSRGGWGVESKKTGPNDVTCIVWALGVCVFFSFVFFFNTNYIFRIQPTKCMIGRWMGVETKKTGPNDAKCVIWALSEFFLIFLACFFLLTTYLGVNLLNTRLESGWRAETRKTGPNDASRIAWALLG